VFTLSQDGILKIWYIENGQKLKTITELHGNAGVTCMEFDETNTKILTAGTDGTIKMWDFNGHCYHTLDSNNGEISDITQILAIKRRIISVGASR
jgi:WD40 repeat protein